MLQHAVDRLEREACAFRVDRSAEEKICDGSTGLPEQTVNPFWQRLRFHRRRGRVMARDGARAECRAAVRHIPPFGNRGARDLYAGPDDEIDIFAGGPNRFEELRREHARQILGLPAERLKIGADRAEQPLDVDAVGARFESPCGNPRHEIGRGNEAYDVSSGRERVGQRKHRLNIAACAVRRQKEPHCSASRDISQLPPTLRGLRVRGAKPRLVFAFQG